MPSASRPPMRELTVVAQDPSVAVDGDVLMTTVTIPAETLAPGPTGFRVQVVDYDSTIDQLYRPLVYADDLTDPYHGISARQRLESDPHFHCQNVYAIVMSTLSRFEAALGRRVAWGFSGDAHQIKVVPHAFAEANAFYSRDDEALLFGYFQGTQHRVFTSLSYDVIAHETTHALVDGLRNRFLQPSSLDQAAFHEGFADLVALLSIFAHENVVGALLKPGRARGDGLVPRSALTLEALQASLLSGLAEQMGAEMESVRGSALRQSAKIPRSKDLLAQGEFLLPHRRGEVLVAAMMNAFLEVWITGIERLGEVRAGLVNRQAVVEEGARVASRLLTMAIRSLDYTPPVDLQFGDFLTALLTADREVSPDERSEALRGTLRATFEAYGIAPVTKSGIWDPPPDLEKLAYDRSQFEPMQRDMEEVFRFIWENRKILELNPSAYTYVQSVRPSSRRGLGGFFLRETVAEYVQILDLRASELLRFRIRKPTEMPGDQPVRLYGGGSLVFDDYGRLKYHVGSGVASRKRQSNRLQHLWEQGNFERVAERGASFAQLHRERSGVDGFSAERW